MEMGKEDLVAMARWYAGRLAVSLRDANQPRYRKDARALMSHVFELLDGLDRLDRGADLPPITGTLDMKIDLDMLKGE